MKRALEGRTVALAEGRQLEDLSQMFAAEGATVFPCPLISILDSPDEPAVVAWLRELCADHFAWLVIMTGEAVRRLVAIAERAGLRQETVQSLGRVRILTRGPKPGKALQEIGLAPTRVAPVPTTEGVIDALRAERLTGTRVGVTLSGGPNPPLVHFLSTAGAAVATVLPYVYAPAAEADRVADLIQQMSDGRIDVLLFTSSPQVDRLFEVARARELEAVLHNGLHRTHLAAIGPVVAKSLSAHGAPTPICPQQGFVMKNIVQHVKRALSSSL